MRSVTILACIAILSGCAVLPEDRQPLVRKDHYVKLKSSAPGMAGAETSVYVREIPAAASSPVAKADRVVLFVHGGAWGGSTLFDLPHSDYSWMRYFANAGYDAFALDFTGFGLSTRPLPMNDPCNLPEAQQRTFVPVLIPAPCPPSHSGPITTMASDVEEMDAVIEYVRKLRGVDKVSIVGYSRAVPRAAGYILRHPTKVSRVFIYAPSYGRNWSSDNPRSVAPFAVVTRAPPAAPPPGCEGHQEDPDVRDLVWKESVATDPLSTAWGGVRRELPFLAYGVNQESAKGVRVPFATAVGAIDRLHTPATAKTFYEDLGSTEKVLIDLACSSHRAMWEKNRTLLFKASLEWIRDGKIGGVSRGEIKLGY